MAYAILHRDDLERTGNWALVRRSLSASSFGVNLVEIPSGESIPEHDETGRDQEELFFVISGSPAVVIDGEAHLVALHRAGEYRSAELGDLFELARSTVYRAIQREQRRRTARTPSESTTPPVLR